MQRIGMLVRDARRHRGLTQQQLAERLGTSQSAVARIEQGGQNLTLELLGRLSEALERELFSVGPSGPTHLRVSGGVPLRGSVTVKSSKNADRKSTRLNSSHANISYAVFCLKKKNRHAVALH